MIPNDIIPSEPMRNAVTKTSETANVQDTAFETEGRGQIASTDSATARPEVHGEIDAEGLKAATHKIRSACYRFSSLQPDMEAWLESSAYSVVRAYLDATPAPEPQPEVTAEPVAYLKEWIDPNGDYRKRVDLHNSLDKWMLDYEPTVTPLYATPSVVEKAVKAEREACAVTAELVGNFGDYKREELTKDFGQPRFDMMVSIVAAIRARGDATRSGATNAQLKQVGFENQETAKYKAEAEEALAMYNQEVEAHAKLEHSLLRLSDKDRQLLRMIVPFVDQRSREPNDAWNMAAAVLWLLIDTTDPIAAFRPAPPARSATP